MRKLALFVVTLLALIVLPVGGAGAGPIKSLSDNFTTVPTFRFDESGLKGGSQLSLLQSGYFSPLPDSVAYDWFYKSADGTITHFEADRVSALSVWLHDQAQNLTGATIYVDITASRSGYTDRVVHTAGLKVKKFLNDGGTGIGNLVGGEKVGETLSIDWSGWNSSAESAITGVTTRYGWYRDGVLIPRASSATYKLQPSDIGTRISVLIRGSKVGYYPFFFSTVTANQITLGEFAVTRTPSISGELAPGKRLVASVGAWLPIPSNYSYQWLREGIEIPGATASSYILTSDDVGRIITVSITATKTGYVPRAEISAPTDSVQSYAFTKTSTPVIRGSLGIGKTLTIQYGSWAPQPDQFDVQWFRNGAAITDANSDQYTLTREDAGKKISVRVSGQKADTAPVSRSSAALFNWKKKSFSKTISGASICAASVNTGTSFLPCSTSVFNGSVGRMYSDFAGAMSFRVPISVAGKVQSWKIRFNGIWKDKGSVFRYAPTNGDGSATGSASFVPQGNFGYIWSPYRSWTTGSSNLQTGSYVYFNVTSRSIWTSLYFNSVTIWYTSWI